MIEIRLATEAEIKVLTKEQFDKLSAAYGRKPKLEELISMLVIHYSNSGDKIHLNADTVVEVARELLGH